jgi:hypothetical protein
MFNDTVTVLEDGRGRAAGRCNRCEMYISTSVPSGESAMAELSKLFERHFVEDHSPKQKAAESQASLAA